MATARPVVRTAANTLRAPLARPASLSLTHSAAQHLSSPQPAAQLSTTAPRRAFDAPLNIPKWLAANEHRLKPPVSNFSVSHDPLTVMIVGGPNGRTDYHINETPEFFYQYRGAMLLRTVQPGPPPTFVDIPIREGCMYLLPAHVPHCPVRFADTVGVVVEQPRPEGALDRLRWYCQGCGTQVAEKSFRYVDLGAQIKAAVDEFEADSAARKCGKCGTVCDVRPPDVEALRPSPEE